MPTIFIAKLATGVAENVKKLRKTELGLKTETILRLLAPRSRKGHTLVMHFLSRWALVAALSALGPLLTFSSTADDQAEALTPDWRAFSICAEMIALHKADPRAAAERYLPWVHGYLAGRNMLRLEGGEEPLSFPQKGNLTDDLQYSFLLGYCRWKPDSFFVNAALELEKELRLNPRPKPSD